MQTFDIIKPLSRVVRPLLVSLSMLAAAVPLAYGADASNPPATASAAPQSGAPPLFGTDRSALAADGGFKRDRQVVRAQAVSIDTRLLGRMLGDATSVTGQQYPITLNLFDDVSFVADLKQASRKADGMTWTGTLRGVEHSEVVIVAVGDVIAGNISMPDGRYHIRSVGNGVHEVQQIDAVMFPEDEPAVPIPKEANTQQLSSASDVAIQADDGSIIDVMVPYTALARAAAGGTPQIQSLIALAIAETNQAYQNSGVTQRLRLVHSVEVNYAEPVGTSPYGVFGTALDCITSTSDACLDEIHGLRNTYGADLVSFWIESDHSYCGFGWFMQSVSASFASNGFSVVARDCATGYYSFGHELGHNMGLMHDTYVDSGTLPYTYAHGYTAPSASSPWRTIMAYNNACAFVQKNCTRIQYWSNPNLTYNGALMGDASTADDHRALNNTALTVANFRVAVQPPTCSYVLGAPSQAAGAAATVGNVNVTVASGCAWTAVSNAAWIVVTSGASGNGNGSVGFSIAANTGTAARSGTITIAGKTFTVNQGFDDGFPSGASLPAGWVQAPGSNAAWAVASGTAFGGGASIRSGAIANGQNSAIQISGKYKAGNVSFALKVDSQLNADYLRFYIDGAVQGTWSGAVDWTTVNYPVAAGQHTFKWEYKKDASAATGNDAAWIDNVVLPPKVGAGDVNLLLLLD